MKDIIIPPQQYGCTLSSTSAIYIAALLLIITQIEIEAFYVQPTKYRVSSTRIKGNFLDNFIVNRKENDDNKPNHRVYKKWKSKEEEARRKANTYQGKKITVCVLFPFRVFLFWSTLHSHKSIYRFSSLFSHITFSFLQMSIIG